MSTSTTGAPYPYMCFNAKADALLALGKPQEARKITEGLLNSERQRKAALYEAMTLQTRAQINLAQHDVASAISDLNGAIAICQREGYDRALIEMRITLADIYRGRGDLGKAETLLTGAAAATQKNGELYTLPLRLRVLAEVQEAEGNFAAADRTYDRADAFIDANIGNDPLFSIRPHGSICERSLRRAFQPARQGPEQSRQSLFRRRTGAWPRHDRPASRWFAGTSKGTRKRTLDLSIAATDDGGEVDPEVEKIRDQISLLEQARWLTPEVSILKSRRYSHVPLRDVQTNLSPNARSWSMCWPNPLPGVW